MRATTRAPAILHCNTVHSTHISLSLLTAPMLTQHESSAIKTNEIKGPSRSHQAQQHALSSEMRWTLCHPPTTTDSTVARWDALACKK